MNLVLCEGDDDAAVIKGLCSAAEITNLRIEQLGGKDRLRNHLLQLPKRTEFVTKGVDRVGIVLDADLSRASSWQKLRANVFDAFKVKLDEEGVLHGDQPRVAGMLVGGRSGQGSMEDLCLESVSNQPEYPCLSEYFQCLEEKTGRKNYRSKARFRAWMATQADFELHVGKAAEAGYLPWADPAFDQLRNFLRLLAS